MMVRSGVLRTGPRSGVCSGLSLLLMLLAAPACTPSALVVHRTVALDPAPSAWRDVTAAVAASLPPLPYALATISTSEGWLALVDPALLEVGPPTVIVPTRHESIAIGSRDGAPLLPEGVRLIHFVESDGGATAGNLDVAIEAAESLLTAPHVPSGAGAMAQAALRSALSSQGVESSAVRSIEMAPEPTAALRVYESFVGKDHRPEALIPDARRAAHHISHLIREETAARAAYLRNNDAAVAARAGANKPPHPLTIVLDNVRSAYNVGSLFRTADTARCSEVVTCGFTPHPPHPKLAKTAFGALESVPTRHVESTLQEVRSLQKAGVTVYAMETTDRSVNYCAKGTFPPGAPAALVLGNEQIGVDTQVLGAVDAILEIPTFGLKNSLNVASAGSIVIFEALRQWGALEESDGGAMIRGE